MMCIEIMLMLWVVGTSVKRVTYVLMLCRLLKMNAVKHGMILGGRIFFHTFTV